MQNLSTPGITFGADRNAGVTAICRVIFEQLAESGYATSNVVRDSRSWRRNYTSSFAAAVPLEFDAAADAHIESILGAFVELAATSDGSPLREVVQGAWQNPNLIELRKVSGELAAQPVALPDSDWLTDAQRQVDWNLAEAALLPAAEQLDGLTTPIELPALIAFAGGAELSAASHWLRWGGTVLLLARTAGAELGQLEQLATESGGTLWVVADAATGQFGIDLVVRPELAAAAIARFVAAHPKKNLLFGHFGYAPGIAHLRLESVAQALIELLVAKVANERLQFSWLATPTDSLAVPAEFAKQRQIHWSQRPALQRAIEAPWRAFGYLKPPSLMRFSSANGEQLGVLDSAARLQGPSYSLAKRMQRWRAHWLRQRGILTSYQITPPARTNSVLGHKILRATYRGASRFGIHPFDSYSASVWPAALFALDSLGKPPEVKTTSGSETDWYFARAIHAGLWRTRYEAATIWIPATALGLLLPAREDRD